MLMKGYKNLTEEELTLILNNCFANIFVTDGSGNIIFVNKEGAEVLCVPEEYLLTRSSKDLVDEGIIDNSTTLHTLQTKERTVGSFTNREGSAIVAITTPVFGKDGELIMAVTYSRKMTDMDMFIKELEKERGRTTRYKSAVDYFDKNKKDANVIIYESKVMADLCETARLIAPTDSTVMLYGESGVGKEVFANYIHNYSLRKDEIFVPINGAAIPAELLESEFFGYEKGAFTGANTKGKSGLFEIADKGTIFLDEIGELPLAMQSKLLRVLESGEFRRIGSETHQKTDVRIIGATNRNLMEMVKEKNFREDLYYRLNVLPMEVPSLRERKEDIVVLAYYFLGRTNKKYGKHCDLDEKQIEKICAYSWPGNVRELRNFIERYVVTGNAQIIENLQYEDGVRENKDGEDRGPAPVSILSGGIQPLKEKIDALELEYIRAVLQYNDNNVQKTADMLGVHRSLIYRKIKNK